MSNATSSSYVPKKFSTYGQVLSFFKPYIPIMKPRPLNLASCDLITHRDNTPLFIRKLFSVMLKSDLKTGN